MNIRIVCVGKLKEKFLVDATNEYVKRLSKYAKAEIVELSETKLVNDTPSEIKKVVDSECEKILSKLDKSDFNIILSLRGKQYDSVEFSKKLEKEMDRHANYTFIIGGSYGTNAKLEEFADLSLCLSKMTFPHQLTRVILLEQIYRAFKIMHNETYHK